MSVTAQDVEAAYDRHMAAVEAMMNEAYGSDDHRALYRAMGETLHEYLSIEAEWYRHHPAYHWREEV